MKKGGTHAVAFCGNGAPNNAKPLFAHFAGHRERHLVIRLAVLPSSPRRLDVVGVHDTDGCLVDVGVFGLHVAATVKREVKPLGRGARRVELEPRLVAHGTVVGRHQLVTVEVVNGHHLVVGPWKKVFDDNATGRPDPVLDGGGTVGRLGLPGSGEAFICSNASTASSPAIAPAGTSRHAKTITTIALVFTVALLSVDESLESRYKN